MNVLFTGSGKSGSYAIRADQLGRAVGGDVVPNALDLAAYDAVVLVKKPRLDIAERAHRARVPLIYDVLDAWRQPDGNSWGEAECKAWLAAQIKALKPAGIVAATKVMAEDCERFDVPVLYLPHHCRPGLERNPIRESVLKVGYEGGEQYLGAWRRVMERECERRGWQWVVNPASLAELDIVVALREQDGYAARNWKSGVKCSNAQGSGTPFIGTREAGYQEQSVGVERFVSDEAEMRRALDALAPHAERKRAAGFMLSVAPTLEGVARTYRQWLETIACTTATSC